MAIQDTQQINWIPIIQELEIIIVKNWLVQRREELITYKCDDLTSYRQRPDITVLSRCTDQVAAVKIRNKYSIPFVIRGSGTGLSGRALSTKRSVVILTSLMR